MIVLGNLPSSKYVEGLYTNTVNILHKDGEEHRVKRKLRLLGSPAKVTKMSSLYIIKNRKIVLHNVKSIIESFLERILNLRLHIYSMSGRGLLVDFLIQMLKSG